MAILSIQSAVAVGYVGNAMAEPALNALGHEVWRVDTVAFSNHPGRGPFTGDARTPEEVKDIVQGIANLVELSSCTAVLSGYLGEAGTADSVAQAVTFVKQANSEAFYILDPVLGDNGQVFVAAGILEAMRDQLVPLADIVLPNPSELSWLTGRQVTDAEEALAAARALLAEGPNQVVVTGLVEGDEVANYLITANTTLRAASTKRDRRFNGTGDLFAALFIGWLLRSASPAQALASSVAGLEIVMDETLRLGFEDLAIIPCLTSLAAAGEVPTALLPD
ncbi:MAG: pyridoxal kinase [Rhodospirillaceae bacterium]|nr:pyridoxal kinase [Rhodospirillaceae bacterium]